MGIILGNHLIDIWKKENPINKNNVINQLNKLIQYHGENTIMEEAINLIANNIDNFIHGKELFQIAKNNILIEILRRAKNNSNEKIGEVLISRLREEKEEIIREKLLKVIEDRINEINDKDITELMKNIKSTEISDIIQKKFLEKLTKIEGEKDQRIKEKQEIISKLQQELANERAKTNIFLLKFSQKDIDDFDAKYENDSNHKSDSKFTKLHFAAKINSKEIGELLISKGAKINAVDINYINIKVLFLINGI